MQNDEHNKKLADDTAETTQKQTLPPPPKRPEPPKDAKIIKIWRAEDGKVYLNDADLGPGPTFDLLNWAQLIVQMPYFYREISNEMMHMVNHIMKQLHAVMENHIKDAHQGDTSASPEVPVSDPKCVPESSPGLPTDKS